MRSLLALALLPAFTLSMFTFAAPPAEALADPATTSTTTPATAASIAGSTVSGLLGSLASAEPSTAAYDRAYFTHWIDADGDGCNTRQEVLIAESLTPVVMIDRCTVVSGQWYSWFDGETWTAPSDVDIDHFVPLSEAWKSGADLWSTEQRRAFANDLGFDLSLEAVTDNVNQSKGDRDPASWLPPLADATCRYASAWVQVKSRWNLAVDAAERTALEGILAGDCGSQPAAVTVNDGAPDAPATVARFGGADRYVVAAGIAAQYAPEVPVVYIAKGSDYPDALSAAPAAAVAGGPLLLTRPESIPAPVLAELKRLKPAKIVVVGGESAVLPQVFTALQSLAPSVVRIGGPDRYAVSRAVVDYAFGASGATRVYVATGATFPDALSASAAAGARAGAVLLVRGTAPSLDSSTLAFIRGLAPTDGVIVGGPSAVSTGIEASVAGLGLPGGSFRLGGTDRFDTSRAINREAFAGAESVFLATGLNFPDALAGAALAGRQGAPLYVVRGTCVSTQVVGDIRALAPSRLVILGGTSALSPAVESLTPCAVAPPKPPVVAPPVVQPPVTPPTLSNPGDTKNCTDFATWRAAQDWFNLYYPKYGDVAGLDRDGDRIACESNRGAP